MSKSGTESFKITNFQYYSGPNPYLNTGALVCEFIVSSTTRVLDISDYQKAIREFLPNLPKEGIESYGDLFAKILTCLSPLEMDLHLNRVSLHPGENSDCIALQSLHYPTSRSILETVWQWLETITQGENFDFRGNLASLQRQFRDSIYGDPTVYSLLRAADALKIPSFFLWEEGLMQYGYGKYQVRSLSTIFDSDSLLDSDLTTQKDDCKDFLHRLGFPVPQGKIVYTLTEALQVAQKIGYPVAIKPVVGHEGIGVTASIKNATGLKIAFEQAQEAIEGDSGAIIVEQSLLGADVRLLCLGRKFIAALERRPPYVVGDGYSTIASLIARENQTENRQDTPTSPLTQIIVDQVLKDYLAEQGLSLDRVIPEGKIIYLRKVANISSGGVSIDVSDHIHPDNRQLAEDIAAYLDLSCFGVDVISGDIAQSWKQGNFGIIEINASPGVFMHLKPAQGKSIDVPSQIFNFFFPEGKPSRIPIITFNRLEVATLTQIIQGILTIYPDYLVGGICRGGVWLNERARIIQTEYNHNVQALLRHPQLDLLIAEYPETIFQQEGLFYEYSDLVILIEPTDTEIILSNYLSEDGVYLIQLGNTLCKYRGKSSQTYNQINYFNVYLETINELIGETHKPDSSQIF